ncbi:hypothetical protein D9756_001458 [Leucocoprinus leucothites]|uniref:Uncharacterized protein n=1 Tax=Leucocoprinus leucothites TaxID=201217 RepID=A0A8H5G442_9AGAR|nr:hypothetical protein D9756_001458 [Leucoagaricus leucothites]
MSGTGSSQTNQHSATNPLSTFEFPNKRRRWADILITGLTDVLILVLSPEGKVLYCGTAVMELLGWNETDILDLHLNDFIIGEDQAAFQRGFEDSIRTNSELVSYVRLKSNPSMKPGLSSSNDILFEIKGYPHFVMEQGPDCKCFFAIAKPYPSRNITMLNTFLDLQTENERLQQRLAALKAQVNAQITPAGQALPSSDSMYATSSLQHGQYTNTFDDTLKNTSLPGYDGNLVGPNYTGEVQQSSEDPEDSSRKKKLKKSHGTEQYVCRKCGRTDSPEWRKGPDGPKTLCNACGLRWAKQMRKFDEPAEETGSNSSQPSSTPGTEGNTISSA